MRRHEDILPHEAAASGAAQARDVPVILDLDIANRDEELALVLSLALMILDGRPENQPVGMVTAGTKRPEPTETNSAIDFFRRPSWGKDCGKPAADAFCKANGFSESLNAVADAGRGYAPTRIVSNDQICKENCVGWQQIICR